MIRNIFKNIKTRSVEYITLLAGTTIVILWTLFRFATKPISFDLVGQQLLSRHWLDGSLEGSITAPTNYILKMLIIYMPSDLLGASPKIFLILSTIFINAVTFIGLYFVLKRILQYFSVKPGSFFTVSMLWLATVAGSVFWIQFTNSRNIELVAGLALLYLGLLIYRKTTLLRCVVFSLLAGLTFFADPMQLMVTAVVLVVFVVADSVFLQKDKNSRKKAALVLALVAVGYILSSLITCIVRSITNVGFASVSSLSQSLAVFSNVPIVLIATGKNVIRLIAGTNEMGVWRQVANVLLVAILGVVATYSLIKKRGYLKHGSLTLFIGVILVVPVGVYVASGHPVFQTDTSRYLIVLAPALILLFSAIDLNTVSDGLRRLTLVVAIVVVALGAISLTISTVNEVSKGLLVSDNIEIKYRYLQQHGYHYGYASMDTAIPAMYLFGGNGQDRVLLPLSCDKTRLRKTTQFFDKGVFLKSEKQEREVPIILDGNSINNYPSQCGQDLIQKQLGKPIRTDSANNNTVLIYSDEALLKLSFQ